MYIYIFFYFSFYYSSCDVLQDFINSIKVDVDVDVDVEAQIGLQKLCRNLTRAHGGVIIMQYNAVDSPCATTSPKRPQIKNA